MTGRPAYAALAFLFALVGMLALAFVVTAARVVEEQLGSLAQPEPSPTPAAPTPAPSPSYLRGSVRSPAGSTMGGVRVLVYRRDGGCCAADATTNQSGEYELQLAEGGYRVQFLPAVESGLTSQFWRGALSLRKATEVTLPRASSDRIDATLTPGYRLSGTVSGRGLGARVEILASDGDHILALSADNSGRYAVRLPNGSYLVKFFPPGPCCGGTPVQQLRIEVQNGDRLGVDANVP